jgi:hypothetical protein
VSVKAERRLFLKALAAAPAIPGALAGPPPTAAQAPAAPVGDPVVQALAESLQREFGAHLDAAELEEVRREIERNRAAAARLRAALRLANADDPVGRFEARPPVARGPRARS